MLEFQRLLKLFNVIELFLFNEYIWGCLIKIFSYICFLFGKESLYLISKVLRKFSAWINKFILVFNWNHLEMRLFFKSENNFYLLRTFPLILVVFVLFLLSLRFGQISPLAFSGDFTRPRIGMLSLVTVFPVITPSIVVVYRTTFFDQVTSVRLWIWNRYLLTMLTWNRRAIKDGFFGLINPYLVFQSRVVPNFFTCL